MTTPARTAADSTADRPAIHPAQDPTGSTASDPATGGSAAAVVAAEAERLMRLMCETVGAIGDEYRPSVDLHVSGEMFDALEAIRQ